MRIRIQLFGGSQIRPRDTSCSDHKPYKDRVHGNEDKNRFADVKPLEITCVNERDSNEYDHEKKDYISFLSIPLNLHDIKLGVVIPAEAGRVFFMVPKEGQMAVTATATHRLPLIVSNASI